jgi:hypothetical protein
LTGIAVVAVISDDNSGSVLLPTDVRDRVGSSIAVPHAGGGGIVSGWAHVIGAVASALADDQSAAGPGPGARQSMLATVTGAPTPRLRQRLEWIHRQRAGADVTFEPLIYQYESSPLLLSEHIADVAGQAVADVITPAQAAILAGLPESYGDQLPRVIGIVAVTALSTIRLDLVHPGDVRRQVGLRLPEFAWPNWTVALGALTRRTVELHERLVASSGRRQTWRGVSLQDRILAEALAAAVVGGAGEASGVLPEHWAFGFNLFCKLALSAAEDALTDIEDWLRTEFAPRARTPERAASLAVLVQMMARTLHLGCQCKADIDRKELAFVPRGSCRQADHDLRSWRPGAPKPGGRGGLYADTLWGWARRWLGGSDASRAAGQDASQPPKPRPNDVAGSVLARRWLHTDRGADGPSLLYDRLLPEFCHHCRRRAKLAKKGSGSGLTQVERVKCCDHPALVYRSEFSQRGGKSVIKPKLGLIVTSPTGAGGYRSTEPLGPLRICNSSGRYYLTNNNCPECGVSAHLAQHPVVPYGWVLLPLAEAWADLRDPTVASASTINPLTEPAVTAAELRYLEEVFGKVQSEQPELDSAADAWRVVRNWSVAQVGQFCAITGDGGPDLLLRVKRAAEASPPDETGTQALGNGDE